MSEPTNGHDEAGLRDLFDAEVRVADLRVSGEDREQLYAMWAAHLPRRDALRAAAPAPEQEPAGIEKPAALPGAPS